LVSKGLSSESPPDLKLPGHLARTGGTPGLPGKEIPF